MDTIDALAEIAGVEFDHTFRVADGKVVLAGDLTPDVWHDPSGDVTVMGDGWRVMTGLTGQYSYHGAVMHPSEQSGGNVAKTIAEYAHDDPSTVFAYVVVMDESGDMPDDPIGWAIAYRESA